MKFNNNKSKKYIILILTIFLFKKLMNYKINIIYNIKIILSYVKNINGFNKNNNYLNSLLKNKITIIKKYIKRCEPKVSIVSPIYNRENFIIRFLKNIQLQNFNDLEIIFIDDCSLDNSVKLIEEYKKIDERLILIKNKVNKGTFISRNIGAIYSKSKYIILPDPDDILNKDIINLCYKYAEKYDYEVIRFIIHKKNGKYEYNDLNQEEKKEILQPELSTYMFYGNNELRIIDYYIHNKFIKKEVFIKAIQSLNKFYFNMYITLWEDTIISFILYRSIKSFFSLNKIGYFYIKNTQSITKNMFKISELRMKFVFIFIKFIFEYSKNTKYEKDMVNALFTELINHINKEKIFSSLCFNNHQFFFDIIIMFVNCNFINKENKNIFKKLLSECKKKIKYRNKNFL